MKRCPPAAALETLLSLLSFRVRVVSLGQLCETCECRDGVSEGAVTAWVRRWQAEGWLHVRHALTQRALQAGRPVAKWRIGEPPLPFGRVAWQAEIRWRQPTASTPLLVATAKGRGLVGGTAPRRALRARELNHDLLLTAAYLQLNRAEPAAAAAWVGEDTLAFHAACQDSPQRPDALLVGLRPVAIECIGRYDARKLRRLHDCYAEQFGAYWFY